MAKLPSAGANSKLRHCKKTQEMKDIPKTWVPTGKQFEFFKKKNFFLDLSKKFSGTHIRKSNYGYGSL